MRQYIKAFRDCGIPLTEIARLANVTSQALSMYLSDTHRALTEDTERGLQKAFKELAERMEEAQRLMKGGN